MRRIEGSNQKRQVKRKVPRDPLRVDLHRALLDRIVRGELAPGARIKELHISEELGVSRTPLREALLRLEREGFVRSELARGFSVEPLSPREIRESYPIIAALEALAMRSSAPVLPSLLESLTILNAEFAASAGPEHAIDCDNRWHETLISGCPNRRLNQIIAGLKNTLRRYEVFYMMDATLISTSVRQHARVADAIRASELEAAVEALADNWRFGMETLLLRVGEP
jgi:DNA-binding GntR family transcriptional regulator